jgi:RimJ/RimL family protein N-acetyltransferase
MASAGEKSGGLSLVVLVELHVEPWNLGSWRAAEGCGYVREGLLRSWEQVGGHRRDMFVYSIVEDRPTH